MSFTTQMLAGGGSVVGALGIGTIAKHELQKRLAGNHPKNAHEKLYCMRVGPGHIAFLTFFNTPRLKKRKYRKADGTVIKRKLPVVKCERAWFRWPFHRFRQIDTRERPHYMHLQRVQLEDNLIYELHPIITFRVLSEGDAYLALFAVPNWRQQLDTLVSAVIEEVYSSHSHTVALTQPEKLRLEIIKRARLEAKKFGIHVVSVRFSSRGPDEISQHVSNRAAYARAGVDALHQLAEHASRDDMGSLPAALVLGVLGVSTPLAVGSGNSPATEDGSLPLDALVKSNGHAHLEVVSANGNGSA